MNQPQKGTSLEEEFELAKQVAEKCASAMGVQSPIVVVTALCMVFDSMAERHPNLIPMIQGALRALQAVLSEQALTHSTKH